MRLRGAVVVTAVFAGGSLPLAAAGADQNVSSTPISYSPGIKDVLKMVDAKVDPEVIRTYIKNSSVAFNPSASEIIALKDHGVSADLITTLLQRGGELRAEAAKTGKASPSAAAPAPYPYAANPYAAPPSSGYPSDYGAGPAYPADYGYSYPYGYGYPYYYYSYPYYSCGYPYYYNYNWWWWPSWYWSSCFHNQFHHFDHNHFDHNHFAHNGVHGFNSFAHHSGQPFTFAGHAGTTAHSQTFHSTGFAGRSAPFMGQASSFHTAGFSGRPMSVSSHMGFSHPSGGFSGHSVGMAQSGGGSVGGRSMGRR